MKVLREGKEVKGAKIFYNNQSGAPLYVEEDGVNYAAAAYTFEGQRDNVITKGEVLSTETIVEGKDADKEEVNGDVLSTADVSGESSKLEDTK